MERTAAEYESKAYGFVADSKEMKEPESMALAIAAGQVCATLAVAQTLEKVWDQLSYINRKLTSDGNIRS